MRWGRISGEGRAGPFLLGGGELAHHVNGGRNTHIETVVQTELLFIYEPMCSAFDWRHVRNSSTTLSDFGQ